jgi:hypothetical protein
MLRCGSQGLNAKGGLASLEREDVDNNAWTKVASFGWSKWKSAKSLNCVDVLCISVNFKK